MILSFNSSLMNLIIPSDIIIRITPVEKVDNFNLL